MEPESKQTGIAVFLDVENLAIHAQQQGIDFRVAPIVERAGREGRIVFARAYGDFSKPYMSAVKADLQSSVFELSLLPTDVKGKNTADVQLALDALEMCLLPAAPTTVVIGSGDRDFVPLVQKIKRYGTFIIGVGLKGSISATLERICDVYWYYEDLQCRAETVTEAIAAPASSQGPVEHAISVLMRALRTVECEGLQTTGGNVKHVMQQLDPAFKVRELGYSKFTAFVEEAARRGFVTVTPQGMEVLIQPAGSGRDEQEEEPDDERRAAESDQLRDSYRAVLEGKRVPLLPWNDRKRLVEGLWKELREAPDGLTIAEMSECMANIAARLGLYVAKQAIYKITYTLNLSRCFSRDGLATFVEDIWETKVAASCDADEALDRMNVTYLRGIRMDAPGLPLRPEPVARLLFGEPTDTQLQLARQYIRSAETWRDF